MNNILRPSRLNYAKKRHIILNTRGRYSTFLYHSDDATRHEHQITHQPTPALHTTHSLPYKDADAKRRLPPRKSKCSTLLDLGHSLRHAVSRVSNVLGGWGKGGRWRGALQVKESKLARVATKLVNKTRGKITTKDSSQVVIRYSLNDQIQANLLQQ